MVMRWLSFWKALIPPAIAPLTLWMAVALAGPGGVIEVGDESGPTSVAVDVGVGGGTDGVDDGGEGADGGADVGGGTDGVDDGGEDGGSAVEPTPAPEATPAPATTPGPAPVESATLTLCAVMVGSQRTYDVRRVTQTWGEASVTWNNQPTTAAAATASATTPLTPGCMTWDVSADVQAWVNGTGNFGWRVNDRSEDGVKQSSTDFRTSEDGSVPGQRPQLEVTYTAQ